MGPGMFDDTVKSLMFLVALLMLGSAVCGACTLKCVQKYDIKVSVQQTDGGKG